MKTRNRSEKKQTDRRTDRHDWHSTLSGIRNMDDTRDDRQRLSFHRATSRR